METPPKVPYEQRSEGSTGGAGAGGEQDAVRGGWAPGAPGRRDSESCEMSSSIKILLLLRVIL